MVFLQVLVALRTKIKQLGIKIAMLFLGVNFHFYPANPRRLGLGTVDKAADSRGDRILPGDIVVCNLTNALEVENTTYTLHILWSVEMPCA